MIAIVEILNRKGELIGKRIGIELGNGTPEQCKKRIPAGYKFVCWNNESSEDLLVKVLELK